jgi:NTE family protein
MTQVSEGSEHKELGEDGGDIGGHPRGPVGPRNAFVVFQGGGAKGISHIGAVGALADAHVKVLGVAGTSAGAIVAALTAVRYTAEELLATDGSGKHLLSTIDSRLTSATHLFGEKGWRELTSLMALGGSRSDEDDASAHTFGGGQSSTQEGRAKPKVDILWNVAKWWVHRTWWHWIPFLIVIGFFDAFPAAISPRLPAWLAPGPPEWLLALLGDIAVVVFVVVEGCWFGKKILNIGGGLSPTSTIREVLNKAIVTKLQACADSQHVNGGEAWTWSDALTNGITFAQFAEVGGLPLRIVATDVTSQTVRLFSTEDTPAVAVADAACASIGLPIVFEVKGISMTPDAASSNSKHFFLDGGLLSNLPLWVFDEDRSLKGNALTIGFTLEQSAGSQLPAAEQDMPGFGWLMPAIESVVSGPQSIHHRAIEGLLLVSVPTGLGVLSFDRSNLRYCEEVAKAREAALEQLTFQLDFPTQLRVNLQALRDLISQELDTLAGGTTPVEIAVSEFRGVLPQSGSTDWQLRLSLLVQRPGFLRTLRVTASTDPSVMGAGKGARVVPYSDFGLVWDWDDPVYMFDFSPNLRPLSPGSSWWTALPVIPAKDPIDPKADAVILVVESPIRPHFLSQGLNTDANLALANECLLAMSQTIEKSLEAFGLAFRQKYSQSNLVGNRLLEFDQHVRRAQIWQ